MHHPTTKTLAAIVSCNVSYKDSIDAQTLVGVLSGALPFTPWQSHLDTFFNELPKEYIVGVMEENGLTLQNLSAVFNALHPVFQGKNFRELLHEQA
jgi:hypothetical protein